MDIDSKLKALKAKNRLKCHYCAYTTMRFKGKKSGQRRLFAHVISEHADEFLASIGFNGSIGEYMDFIDNGED